MSTSANAGTSMVTATGDFRTVPITDILINPERNTRYGPPSAKKIAELSASIVAEGMHEPLIVSRIENGNGNGNGAVDADVHFLYQLEAGYSRAAAVVAAMETKQHDGFVPVHIEEAKGKGVDAATTAKLMLGVNVSENAQREDFSPMDKAKAICKMLEAGYKLPEVCAKIRLSKGGVSQMKRLMELRPEIQNKIHTGDIGWTVARDLVTMSEADQDAFLAKLAAEKEAGGTTGSGRKGKKGKAAKDDAETPGKKLAISAKKAIQVCEDGIAGVKEEIPEGKEPTKRQAAVEGVLTLVIKLLSGKLGGPAFNRKLAELL